MSPVPLKGHDTHELFPEIFEPPEKCNQPKPPQKESDAARKPARKRNSNRFQEPSRLQIVPAGVQNEAETIPSKGIVSPGQDGGDGCLMDARQVPEPFVSAQEAAKFIGIRRRFLLDLARHGITGAYPLGTGELRKTWVFRLSELATAIDRRNANGSRRPTESEQAYHPNIRRSLLK